MRAVAVIVVVLLSGCMSDSPPDAVPDDPAVDESAALDAPLWEVGQWWTFALGADLVTWVVTEDNSDHYVTDVDSPDWSFNHAAFAQVSTIGPIGKANLEGQQEHGGVRLFDFPLETGKAWTTTWDGSEWHVTVSAVVGDLASIVATSGDNTREYTYDNQTKWIGRMSATDGNGTTLFEAKLHRHGTDYAGTYIRWDLHDEYRDESGFGELSVNTFSVPDEATDIWGAYSITCSPDGLEGEQGFGILEVHPEGDSNAGISEHVTCPITIQETVVMEPHPGQWGVTSQTSGATLEIVLIPRTMHELSL